jgi:hypothetical protein
MSVTATSRGQIGRICDLESERDSGWAEGSTAWCRDTSTLYKRIDGQWVALNSGDGGGVPTSRLINTTAPLSGGGDLTADRTLVIADASTTAKGAVELATDGEAAAGVAVQGNDSRLSNARTPTSHATSHQPGGGDAMAVDAAAGTGSLRTIGTGALTAAAGNDARLSDARTPLAHAASHQNGGSDEISVAGLSGLLADGQTPLAHNILTAHNGFPGGTTNFLRADGSFAAPGGGADPWTYLKLGSDFTISTVAAGDVTGLAFTPLANTQYEFEASLMLRTATATVNPRIGLAWPTGMTDGCASLWIAQAATTQLLAFGNIAAAILTAVGGLPNNTQSWPGGIVGIAKAGATPSGTVRVQLASETAGTIVRVVAGSFLKYRVVP